MPDQMLQKLGNSKAWGPRRALNLFRRGAYKFLRPFLVGLSERSDEIERRIEGGERRVEVGEGRISRLESRQDQAHFLFDAINQRIEQEHWHHLALKDLVHSMLDQSRVLESRIEEAEKTRRALEERLNAADLREAELGRKLGEAQGVIAGLGVQLPALTSLAWDSLALSRRLAVIEDRTEALTARAEAGEALMPTPELLAYPGEAKAAG